MTGGHNQEGTWMHFNQRLPLLHDSFLKHLVSDTALCTHQEGLIKLKGAWELPLQLVNTVQPLQEDRAALVHVLRVLSVAAAVGKLVAEVEPIGLQQNLEALHKDVARSLTRWNDSVLSFSLKSEHNFFTVSILS